MDAKMKRWAKSLCANKYRGAVVRELICMKYSKAERKHILDILNESTTLIDYGFGKRVAVVPWSTNYQYYNMPPDHIALVYPSECGDFIFSVNVVTLKPILSYIQDTGVCPDRQFVDRVLSCMRKIRKGGWDGIEF